MGVGETEEDERLTWNGGAEYMDTQQRCPLQICRRETRLLDVCGEFNKIFTYLTLPYPIGSAINMKLVGDCRDTSSLSVRRPCRKVVN